MEEYVREKILPAALDKPTNLRLLVALEDDRLVGCAAHRPEGLMRGSGELFLAMRLQLVAVGIEDQGRKGSDGTKFSDTLVKAALADILDIGLSRVITAIAARDNLRSIALCERNGLRSQVEFDAAHIRLTGNFVRE